MNDTLTGQGTLLDVEALPPAPQLEVAAATPKSEAYVGTTLLKNQERCDAIVADFFTISVNAICRKYCIDRRSVWSIIHAYNAAGKMPAAKERALAKLDLILALTEDAIVERLEAGTMPAQSLPVLYGIATDKKGQLEAGVVPGTQRTQSEVTAADVELQAKFDRMKRAAVVEIDGQSIVSSLLTDQTGQQSQTNTT